MKKVFLALVVVLMLLLFIPTAGAQNKAKVYMFSRNKCSACEDAKSYFQKLLKEDENLFEFIEIEVFKSAKEIENEDAYMLMLDLLKYYEKDTDTLFTPLIVIGEYFNEGFPNDTSELYEAIKTLNEREEDYDLVKELADEREIKIEDIRKDENAGNLTNAVVIIGLFGVLILGFCGLIFLGKK